jgi:hypothetical protein
LLNIQGLLASYNEKLKAAQSETAKPKASNVYDQANNQESDKSDAAKHRKQSESHGTGNSSSSAKDYSDDQMNAVKKYKRLLDWFPTSDREF